MLRFLFACKQKHPGSVNYTLPGSPAAPSMNLGQYTIKSRPCKKSHKQDREYNHDRDSSLNDGIYFIPFFFAVLADCLDALFVGEPLEPGSRIFSP